MKQKGITLIGFIAMAVLVCAFGLIIIKVTPVYVHHFAVKTSLEKMDTLPKQDLKGPPAVGIAFLKERLFRQLYLNEVRFLTKRDFKIKRTRKGFLIKVPYTVTKKLIANVSLLFEFSPEYEVSLAKK